MYKYIRSCSTRTPSKVEIMPKNLIFFDLTKQNIHFTDIYRIRKQSYLKLAEIEIKFTDERVQIKGSIEAIMEL